MGITHIYNSDEQRAENTILVKANQIEAVIDIQSVPLKSSEINVSFSKLLGKYKENYMFRTSMICAAQLKLIEHQKQTERKVSSVLTSQALGSIALLQAGKHSFEIEDDYRDLTASTQAIHRDVKTLIRLMEQIEDSL